jgi:hypothetical protein
MKLWSKSKRMTRETWRELNKFNLDDKAKRIAVTYTKWLAKRDGIAIPNHNETQVNWSGVYVPDTKGREVYRQRARSVVFGNRRTEWRYVKNGRRSYGYSEEVFEPLLSIPIPNWDYVPTVTELAA